MNSGDTFYNNIDISFIIPVYNTAIDLLIKCIDCITSIKSKKCECVIIDDGSDYNKSIAYEALCNKKAGVRYYRQLNTGVSGARNTGIRISNGRYIYFCDSDDQILPDFFENILIVENYDIYFTKMIISMSKRKKETCKIDTKNCEITKNKIFDSLLLCGFLNGPYCKLIKRKFLLNNNIEFNSKMKNGEDLVFLLSMIRCNPSMYYINISSYIYHYDLNTRKNRVLNEPKRCLEDDKIVANEMIRTAKEIDGSDIMAIESSMTGNRINTIFLDASNIAAYATSKLNTEVKNMYQQEMKKIDVSKILQQTAHLKIEYHIVSNGHWIILFLISKVRRLYLGAKVRVSAYRKGDIE